MKKILVLSVSLNVLGLAMLCWMVWRLGGIGYLRFLFRHQGTAAWYEHRQDLFEKLEMDSTDIVFLGNSITHQGEWAELLDNPRCKNRGISGDVIPRMRERLPAITRYRPATVFLMIGINDLLFSPPEAVANAYEDLVNDLQTQSPASRLYLQSVLPVNNAVKATRVQNSDIRILNDRIRDIAHSNGIVFIDIHALMCDANGELDARYTDDGIHINGMAYRIWAAHLKRHYLL